MPNRLYFYEEFMYFLYLVKNRLLQNKGKGRFPLRCCVVLCILPYVYDKALGLYYISQALDLCHCFSERIPGKYSSLCHRFLREDSQTGSGSCTVFQCLLICIIRKIWRFRRAITYARPVPNIDRNMCYEVNKCICIHVIIYSVNVLLRRVLKHRGTFLHTDR